MSARITAVCSQKGGVGKSSVAETLTAGLSLLKGYKVLAIDLDAQANFTYTAGARTEGATILRVLTGEAKTADAIQHTKGGFDVIAADKALSGVDISISGTGREYKLLEALESIAEAYDHIILDTPPALGLITVNALTACNSVIIPAQADVYSLQGVEQLAETMRPVKRYCNHDLTIAGILLTRYNPRPVLSRDMGELAEQLAARLGTKLFKARIRESIIVKESQASQKNLFVYAPKAKVTGDYRAFIEEFLGESNDGKT